MKKKQLTNTVARELQPAWFPDGKKIIYVSDQDGTRDIWMMSAEGGTAVNLTKHRGKEWYPSVHPDGTRIAFTMDWNGSLGIGSVAIEELID
jgi:TolB protein